MSERGDWAAAAEQLELGMPYGGMGERSRRLLAVAYRNAGRYREAALAYRDLLREEPGSCELLVALAYCLEREGQADYALVLLEKAPKAAKAGPEAWIMQAALYSRSGKTEAAVAALRSAIERDRGNERAWRNLAAIYRRQGLTALAANCEEEGRAAIAAARAASTGAPASSPASSPAESEAEAGPKAAAGRNRGRSAGLGSEGATGLADLDLRSRRKR